MILGAVLAGGQSSRFGSDKALAELDGATLLARAVDSLSAWCDHVVVVGREEAPAPTLPDWPCAGMGPLGGIAAALRFARDEGYEAVLTLGVDAAGLPDDLPALLAPAPAYVASQPVIGLWPASAADAVAAILRGSGKHSLRALAEATGARAVRLGREPANINTEADLAALRGQAGENHDGL
ncbi:molybdenum cofactor guanylyltransferase [Novosphingobium sp.]|uniref:molybdenum cofactor guanylyltransferase n=1 Tax=Novosphingobium sp. TaxID=1874826 RepID=UPI001ED6C465|nr:molybdenum cofactor guanylyltransferase [Novosphingobium sp.]MBK9011961.1 molybdenum cofactor guanylyltransferase [Novosphingobium sp.]